LCRNTDKIRVLLLLHFAGLALSNGVGCVLRALRCLSQAVDSQFVTTHSTRGQSLDVALTNRLNELNAAAPRFELDRPILTGYQLFELLTEHKIVALQAAAAATTNTSTTTSSTSSTTLPPASLQSSTQVSLQATPTTSAQL
jgi:hypothetical protein